jgi:CRP/FNR family transcriptional regulator, cyclic AMP receptor protein
LHPEPLRLRAIPLFADLGPDDLDRVASWLEIREESKGRRLTPEGASGYGFFLIEDGTAEVHHEGAKVGSLGPGDFFGEMAMMGDGRRVADVVATSPITLFEMFGTHFRELEMILPEVAARIGATLEERRAAL